jgi:hypothetical protein
LARGWGVGRRHGQRARVGGGETAGARGSNFEFASAEKKMRDARADDPSMRRVARRRGRTSHDGVFAWFMSLAL